VVVLNGPNLNLLGTREPEVYGSSTLADVERLCAEEAERLGLRLDFRQSNGEGELVGWLQEAGAEARSGRSVGTVLNAGAYTHTSIAIPDAIQATGLPVVEVHISNVHAREPFRHHSYVSAVARGVIVGLGVAGYPLAIRALHDAAPPDPAAHQETAGQPV
jgi:3-dehydroquinate dehydratase-2